MKKVAIMQPYFLPYLGYFSLIKHTDSFILFDTVQFIRHGWIERNRILKQNDGWLYIKVPLIRHSRSDLIKDIKIDNSQPWRQKIMSQLECYKKVAPYYDAVMSLLESSLDLEYNNITECDKHTLEKVCAYLGIKRNLEIFSEMKLKIKESHAPDEWALNICDSLGDVDEYWNPPGGQSFFDKSKYEKLGIKLKFQKPILKPYNQKRLNFEPGLSIVDAMMFNSPKDINIMLDSYELI